MLKFNNGYWCNMTLTFFDRTHIISEENSKYFPEESGTFRNLKKRYHRL